MRGHFNRVAVETQEGSRRATISAAPHQSDLYGGGPLTLSRRLQGSLDLRGANQTVAVSYVSVLS